MALLVDFADGRETYQFLPMEQSTPEQGLSLTIFRPTCLHKGKRTTIYRGTAYTSGNTESDAPVGEFVLKIVVHSDSAEAVTSLQLEHDLYRTRLQHLQGTVVPHCHGLFKARTSGGLVSCLVLDYVGDPFGLPLYQLDMDSRLHLVGQVAKLHDAGLLHGELQERHLLLTASNTFFIVDFQMSQEHTCERAPDVPEGALCPNEHDYGCPEMWKLQRMLRIWRPETLYFLSTVIREESVTTIHDLLEYAKDAGLYEEYNCRAISRAARNLVYKVNSYRRNGGLRPREFCYYDGE